MKASVLPEPSSKAIFLSIVSAGSSVSLAKICIYLHPLSLINRHLKYTSMELWSTRDHQYYVSKAFVGNDGEKRSEQHLPFVYICFMSFKLT